jgi:iron complex outermembrane recepter protein
MSRWLGDKSLALAIAGIMSGVASIPAVAQSGAASDIEEVVVTGSYLRGSPLDAPSPVQVVDRSSIEAQGASQVWDVIKNLEINSGSISNEGADGGNAALGNLSGTANVNLRNLGENSTLTLVNGKRQVSAATTTPSGGEFVDINTIPLVMVDRVEVLTDGGSALYGSDAVAGVVNIIMRTEFEGLELYGDVQAIEKEMGNQDRTVSAIWGWASDSGNTNLVLAGEVFRRDAVPVTAARFYDDRSEFTAPVGGMGTLINQAAFGARVNPAYINQSAVDLAISEGGTSALRYTDPLCDDLTAADGSALFWGTRTSQRGQPSSVCRENDAQWRLLNVGMERDSLSASFMHSFSEAAEFYSFAQWSKSDIERSDSGYVTARGPSMFLAAPGSHQGNPAWAGYAIGQPAELGYFAPAIGLSRPTAADIPNAPIALANGGPNVPMSANVQIGNFPRDGGSTNVNLTETVGVQAGVRGEFYAVNDRRFNYDVSYSWSGTSFELEYQTFQRDRAELAVNGLGGPNCTPNGVSDFNFQSARGHISPALPTFWDFLGGTFTQYYFPGFVHTTRESLSLALTSNNHGQDGCEFYNPFLTSVTDAGLANSPELLDWMTPTVRRADKRNKLAVFDAVLSGDLFQMSGGMAQFAVGAQYREQNNKSRAPYLNDPGIPNAILGWGADGRPDEFHYVSNNYECSQCIFNYDHDRDVKAVFSEFSLPLINNVETQFALRWEDYGDSIGSEVTPKVAASWRPMDELLIRGSFSQSFRAPNVGVQKEGLEAGSITFRDPLRNQAVRAGLARVDNANAQPNTTYTVGAPAPDIGNESANTFGLGFQWTPYGALEGLSVGADFWRFEVKDRVMPQPGISSIAQELTAFEAAAANPSNYVLNSSLANDAAQPFQACDPAALEAQWGSSPDGSRNANGQVIEGSRLDCVVDPRSYVVPDVVRTQGSTEGALVTIVSSSINAGEVTADGVDLKLGYQWVTDFGRFRLSSDFTYVNQYKLSDVPGLELGLLETGVFDAAGTTGDGILVRSLPDVKGNITLNWSSDNLQHSVTVINRYVGSYRDLSYRNNFENGNDFVRSVISEKVDSYNSIDLQYSYVHEWGNPDLGTAIFTVGALDAFNATLPYRYAGALNYDASVFDGRGRRFYARALLQF